MKARIKLLLLLIIVMFFASMAGGKASYFLLYTILFVLIIPMAHSLIGILTIKAKIDLKESIVYAGDSVNINYKIYSKLPISFAKVKIESYIDHKLINKDPVKETFSLGIRKPYYNKTEIICRRRGNYQVGHIKISVGDVFNFFNFSKTISSPINLKVYPKIRPIYKLLLRANEPMGDLLVDNRFLQDYTEISNLRPYEKGDNIRNIHWKASAKQEDLLVKNFETKGNTDLMVILDSSAKSYAEDKDNEVEDKAVEIALSIINYCLRKNIKASLFYEKNKESLHIKGNDISDLESFMENLIRFAPLEEIDFSNQVSKYSPLFSQDLVPIFITPTIDKNLAAKLVQWKTMGLNPSYILLDSNKEKYKSIIESLRGEGLQVYQTSSIDEASIGLEESYEK